MEYGCFIWKSILTRRAVLVLLLFVILLAIPPPTTAKRKPINLDDVSPFTPSATLLPVNIGLNQLESAIIDSSAGYAYFGTNAAPAMIFKIRLSDFTNIANLTLAPGEAGAITAAMSPTGHIAYFGTSTGQLVKLNLTSFTETASSNLAVGGIVSATIDPAGVFAYLGTDTGNIVKVRLSDLTVARTLPLGQHTIIGPGVVDTANGYAYFGATGCGLNIFYAPPPNMIVKIRLSDFNITAHLDPGEDCLTSATLDSTADFAYFAGSNIGGHLLRVRLSDFSMTGALAPEPMNTVSSLALDPTRGVGYLLENAAFSVTFRLSDLNQIDSTYTYQGLFSQRAATVDPATGNVYFTARELPFGIQSINVIARLAPSSLPINDFSLTPTPSTVTLQQGSVAASYIDIESNNYTGTINLTTTTTSLSAVTPTPTFLWLSVKLVLNGENSSILTIMAPREDDVPAGSFIVTVMATSGGITREASLRVIVTPIEFQLFIQPNSLGLHPGGGYDPSIALRTQTGFSGTINLTATINPLRPEGPRFTVSPSSVTLNLIPGYTGISNIFIATNNTTSPGQYEIEVTGTSGTQTSTASFCLLIVPSGVVRFCVLPSLNHVYIAPGQSRTSLITVYKTVGLLNNTYLGTVNLSATTITTVPAGTNMVTATFSPSTISVPYQLPGPEKLRSILTVSASSTAPAGDYLVRITVTNGTVTGSVDIPVVVTPSLVPGIPGLFHGETAEYHISSVLAVTTRSSLPTIPGISEYLNAYSATLRTATTVGDETAGLLTISYLNGTDKTLSIQGNIRTESGTLFPWAIGTDLTFNTTMTREYADASRQTTTLTITRTNNTVTSTGTWTWDIRTGLLLESSLALQGTGPLGSINAYVHITLSDTKIWTATQPYFTVTPITSFLTIEEDLATRIDFSIKSENNFTNTINLAAQPLPFTPTLSLALSASFNLQAGRNLTTSLIIIPANTGRYLILLNATSAAQFHYATLHITVVHPRPVLTITGLLPSPARVGETITLSFTIHNPNTVADITIDWGDGTTVSGLPVTATRSEHFYRTPGIYIITITVTDDTGATSLPTTTTLKVDAQPTPTIPPQSVPPLSPVILYGIAATIIATLAGAVLALTTRRRKTALPLP